MLLDFLPRGKYFKIKPRANKSEAFIYGEPQINVHILNFDNQVFGKISSDPVQCYSIKVSVLSEFNILVDSEIIVLFG